MEVVIKILAFVTRALAIMYPPAKAFPMQKEKGRVDIDLAFFWDSGKSCNGVLQSLRECGQILWKSHP